MMSKKWLVCLLMWFAAPFIIGQGCPNPSAKTTASLETPIESTRRICVDEFRLAKDETRIIEKLVRSDHAHGVAREEAISFLLGICDECERPCATMMVDIVYASP